MITEADGYLSELELAAANTPTAYNMYRLGIAYEMNGKPKDAINMLEKTIQLMPGQKDVYQELIMLYDMNKSGIFVFMNGRKMSFNNGKEEVKPMILDGHTLLPIRKLSESLGAQVAWKRESSRFFVKIILPDTTIIINQNSDKAVVNGIPVKMDVPAKNIQGHILVPLRFIAEQMHKRVNYISNGSGTAIITISNNISAEIPAESTDSLTVEDWYSRFQNMLQHEEILYNNMNMQNNQNMRLMNSLFSNVNYTDLLRIKAVHDQNHVLYETNSALFQEYYFLTSKERYDSDKLTYAQIEQVKARLSPIIGLMKSNQNSIKDIVTQVDNTENHIRSAFEPVASLEAQLRILWDKEHALQVERISGWEAVDSAIKSNNTASAIQELNQIAYIKEQIYNTRLNIYLLMQQAGAILTQIAQTPSTDLPATIDKGVQPPSTEPVIIDTQAPTIPAGLMATASSISEVNLSWSASTDNVGVTGYDVYRDGTLIGTTASTSYSDMGLTPSTSYSYTVKAKDGAGNISAVSNAASATTLTLIDTQPPTAPAGLNTTASSISEVNLSWSASTDNVGVAGYDVYRDGTLIGTTASTSYSDMGLTPSTSYSYTVKAKDGAGNTSAASNASSATTLTPPDTQAPTAPAGLSATASSISEVNLSWSASTDDVGVTGYDVYRDGTLIGTTASTTYNDMGLTPSTSYSYTVKAKDGAGNTSATSNAASATTLTSLDTQAPTAPSGLSATASSISEVNLNWSASTDNVGVTGYDVYRDGTLIGTTASTSYSDMGLTPPTSYSYTVKAKDGAGNVSAASNAASATTLTSLDTQAPTAPSVLSATASSISEVNLNWSASTDNVGVTGYDVYRDGTLIGTTANTTYSDMGLTPSTSYSYTVKAKDGAGNASAASNAASATTLTPADTQAPTVPSGLSATASSISEVNLSWSASTDNVGVTGYDVYRDGTLIGTTASTTYNDMGLTPSTSYSYTVKAKDGAGNTSATSNAASATTLTSLDTQAPTAPSGLSATASSISEVNLNWSASTDNVGVTGYDVYRDGTLIGTTASTSYSDMGLTPPTSYSYTVKAKDGAGNVSAASNAASATTLTSLDTQAPTAPSVLSATASSISEVNLNWSASTDNVGVTGYDVYRDGTLIGTTANTTYSDMGLTPSTSYSYTVKAKDGAGNASAASNAASATTLTPADTQAPTVPSGLSATASSISEVNLSWSASTDNVGVTGYDVYRDGTLIGTTASTTYNDMGLTPSTSYSYTVKAKDGAGNTSAASNAASATTLTPLDTQAPTVPSGLSATASSISEVNLSWSASTDNVGVTGYDVYRDGTLIGTTASTTYSDIGLTASTSYSYTVKAKDGAGNTSAASNAASATTLTPLDTQAPTVPSGLNATASSISEVNLSWSASTDNVGVTGYDVYRDGTLIGTTASTTYSDMGLTPSTYYSYTVKAKDGAGNTSAVSNSASATTLTLIDTQAPTAPAGLTATTVSTSQINLSWTASTDNTGVVGYDIYRNGSLLNTTTQTTYIETGLSPSSLYSYTVKARDAAGNTSTVSNTASALTFAGSGTYTVLNSAGWIASTNSTSGTDPAALFDWNLGTRWSTGKTQAAGQYLVVDMGTVQNFNRIVMDSTNDPNDYARSYEIYVSNDNINWGSPVASGSGISGNNVVDIAAQNARYIKIVLMSSSANWWSIDEFKVYDNLVHPKQALVRTGWTLTPSTPLTSELPANMIDGEISTRWSSGAAQATGQYLIVDMKSIRSFSRIMMEVNIGSSGDFARNFEVYISDDGMNWGTAIATGTGKMTTIVDFNQHTAQFIKIVLTSSIANWWSIHELNIYDEATGP
ncbi:fibronectin type III domain-containing protein [Paenibacillus sp. sgz5001063]|uniref:fibronectin type III domain-containing protein n=1 Tax=Paenibacillus sp. sgz5001063 TaxID=3242474 RepID=UPI0036D3BB5A